MSTIVRLLGRAAIEIAGQVWEPPADLRHAVLSYLAYLATWTPRDDLLYLFWPDADEGRARANLRQLLVAIRALPYAADLEVERTRLRWLPETDVVTWQRTLAAGELPDPARWPEGPLLDGFRLPRAPEFESWLELERASLLQRARRVVLETAEIAARDGRPQDALTVLDAWLLREPLDEEAVRAAMIVGNDAGWRAAALARFTAFRANLSRELGFAPEPSTLELARALELNRRKDASVPRMQRAVSRASSLRDRSPHSEMFGREVEVARLETAILRGGGPVVTLLAMGGMGKTRLALEVVDRLRSRFPDGAATVLLAEADHADKLGSALVEGLRFDPAPMRPLMEQVEAFLAPRSMLVLLDNVEHLDGVAEAVTRLRAAAPDVAWLLTSRARVGVVGETILEIQGLPYPQAEDEIATGAYASVDLLADRARRAGRELDLARDARDIARVCRATAGMPLALELAAGWLRVLPIARIADELEGGIDVLVAAEPRPDPRHASMRVVFEASWNALSPAERSAAMALSAFPGGFDEEAARQVALVGRPLLLALRNKSFLSLDADGRFHRHPLLDTFVRERAERHPEILDAARERHALWYMAYLAHWEREGASGPDETADRALAREHANLEAAWAYVLDAGMRDASWWDHLKHGGAQFGLSYLAAGRPLRWSELLRAALARVPPETATWAILEAHESSIAEFAGRSDEAFARRSRAVSLLRLHHDPTSLAWASMLLAESARSLGRIEEAHAALEESLTLFETLREDHLAGMLLLKLQETADEPSAKEHYFRLGEENRRRTGNQGQAVVARRDYADFIAHAHGEFDRAIALIDEVLPGAHRYGGVPIGEPLTLRLSAEIRLAAGDVGMARRHVLEALALWPRYRAVFPHFEAELTTLLAACAFLQGDIEHANEVVAPVTAAGATVVGSMLRCALAAREGDLHQAWMSADQALVAASARAKDRPGRRLLARALVSRAEVGIDVGNVTAARSDVLRALALTVDHHFLPLLLRTCVAATPLLADDQARSVRAWAAGHPAAEFDLRRMLADVPAIRDHPAERDELWRAALTVANRVRGAIEDDRGAQGSAVSD